ncbi:pep-cterm sorting domain-containing protein [Anaeramoeba flamelloides]|uniref:Pep-cterm sorting domain-containing protein n=1 Tax=Anaeramoeba flamelloides TaxID=1746091 RepID=A0AAV7YVM2_9EUKA|nr:pep-cterm sorting domain-containing protein [Anaeramoeba flamelloides]
MTFYQVTTFSIFCPWEGDEGHSTQNLSYHRTFESAEFFAVKKFYEDWKETLDQYMEAKMWDYFLVGDLARQLNEWETNNIEDYAFKPIIIKYEPNSESEFPVITTCAFDEFAFVYKLYDYIWYKTYGLPNLVEDLKKLQTDESSTDCTICGVKCHSALVKARTEQPTVEELEKKLEEFKEQTDLLKIFFNWVYQNSDPIASCSKEEDKNTMKQLLTKLGLDLTKNKCFVKDLQTMSLDKDTQDFDILCSDDESVKFHHYFLKTRLKSFASVFQNVETIPENLKDKHNSIFWNQFKDYLYTGNMQWSKIYMKEDLLKDFSTLEKDFEISNIGFKNYFAVFGEKYMKDYESHKSRNLNNSYDPKKAIETKFFL